MKLTLVTDQDVHRSFIRILKLRFDLTVNQLENTRLKI